MAPAQSRQVSVGDVLDSAAGRIGAEHFLAAGRRARYRAIADLTCRVDANDLHATIGELARLNLAVLEARDVPVSLPIRRVHVDHGARGRQSSRTVTTRAPVAGCRARRFSAPDQPSSGVPGWPETTFQSAFAVSAGLVDVVGESGPTRAIQRLAVTKEPRPVERGSSGLAAV